MMKAKNDPATSCSPRSLCALRKMSDTKPTPAEDRALVAEFLNLVNADPEFLKSKLHAFDMQIMDHSL